MEMKMKRVELLAPLLTLQSGSKYVIDSVDMDGDGDGDMDGDGEGYTLTFFAYSDYSGKEECFSETGAIKIFKTFELAKEKAYADYLLKLTQRLKEKEAKSTPLLKEQEELKEAIVGIRACEDEDGE